MPHLACLGIPCPKEQTDYIMEPSDLQFKTSCLNRTWMGTWDHFPVVVKIDGKELRVQEGREERVGFPNLRVTDRSFKNWLSVSFLEEKARKARGELDATVGALPRGKTAEASCEETLGRREVLVKTGKNGW